MVIIWLNAALSSVDVCKDVGLMIPTLPLNDDEGTKAIVVSTIMEERRDSIQSNPPSSPKQKILTFDKIFFAKVGIKLMQDQISGPGYPIFDFIHSGPYSQKCRMIGHCNKTTRNNDLKLHKAPLLYICSLHTELYCLDRPGKNRLFFVSRKA